MVRKIRVSLDDADLRDAKVLACLDNLGALSLHRRGEAIRELLYHGIVYRDLLYQDPPAGNAVHAPVPDRRNIIKSNNGHVEPRRPAEVVKTIKRKCKNTNPSRLTNSKRLRQ